MAPSPYADRVNITKYVKHDGRWRFAPIARRAGGNFHWDHVLIDGLSEHYPEGKYFIEWRENGSRRGSVGTAPAEILAEAQRQRTLLDAKHAGIALEDSEAKPLTRQLLVVDAVARYLRDVKMNKSGSTFRRYSQTLNLFQQSLVKATVDAINRDDMMDFQASLYKLGLSARTVKHKTIIVTLFLKTLGVRDPLCKGDWPNYTEEDPEIYTPEELQRFFAACTPEEVLLFRFFLHSGFRDGEVRHAHWTEPRFYAWDREGEA